MRKVRANPLTPMLASLKSAHNLFLKNQAAKGTDETAKFMRRAAALGIPEHLIQSILAQVLDQTADATDETELAPELADELFAQRMEKLSKVDFENVLSTRGPKATMKLMENMALEFMSDVTEAAERERKETKRVREAAELIQQGIQLGIPESTMQSCLAQGLHQARLALAEQKRTVDLLERAGNSGCAGTVQRLIELRKFDEADTLVVKAKALIEQATRLGVEATACGHLEAGNLSLAETAVADAKKRVEFQKMWNRLDARINGLSSASLQSESRRLLSELNVEHYGDGSFNNRLMLLERKLSG